MHPLSQKIASIQHRLIWRRRAVAACWILATAIAAALLLGLADYLTRFSDAGLRIMATLAFAAANLTHGATYTVHSVAQDAAGNNETDASATFTFDTAAPTSTALLASHPALQRRIASKTFSGTGIAVVSSSSATSLSISASPSMV